MRTAALLGVLWRSSPSALALQQQQPTPLARTVPNLYRHFLPIFVSSGSPTGRSIFSSNNWRIGSTSEATAEQQRAYHSTSSGNDASSEMAESSLLKSSKIEASSMKFIKPPRVVPDTLPILYVYDHCPFCVRVRVALGLKNVKHELRFLANDDTATPINLLGQKIAPIMQYQDVVMKESMDIISYVESLEEMGAPVILPATSRTDLKEWQSSVQNLLRGLQRPRYVATGLLPEFQQLDSRHAFISNHPMPPYAKPEWKEMKLPVKLSIYAENMAKDPAGEIEELNIKLVELDDIIHSSDHCSPGGISLDDVDLFSRLRSVTIIKGVIWPVKLRSYMDRMAELVDIPLYDEMAL